jgi:ABC-type sugar transport system permease subunit
VKLRRSSQPEQQAVRDPRYIGYAYVAPALALYVALVLVPLVRGIRLSFFSWDGIGSQTWVGLSNFKTIWHDPVMRSSFLHSFELILFYSVLPILIGLFVTALISRHRVRGLPFFRVTLFLPQIIPLVAAGAIWRWIYGPTTGLNGLLGAVGLSGLERPWLDDYTFALPALGMTGTWVLFGLCIVLFFAGVQKIPQSLYDAARVDGASGVREFFAVTLPGLWNEISVALVLTIVSALHTFDVVYVTTQGGPGTTTVVPALLVYREAFTYGAVGVGAALGVVLAVVVVILTIVVLQVERRSVSLQ